MKLYLDTISSPRLTHPHRNLMAYVIFRNQHKPLFGGLTGHGELFKEVLTNLGVREDTRLYQAIRLLHVVECGNEPPVNFADSIFHCAVVSRGLDLRI